VTQPSPKKAMLLAAGLGTRMRPLSANKPKVLIQVQGRTLLDLALDRLEDAGVETVVINLHYLGDMIEEHLSKRSSPEILFSREKTLLETGGGVKKALPLLGDGPFFVVNGDVFWLNGTRDSLLAIAALWDDDAMDALLLLHPTVNAHGYDGRGDFYASPCGRLHRRSEQEVSPYLFAGIQIIHPRLLKDAPEGPFSMNLLYDLGIARERLLGTLHDGEWFHVGSPEGLDEAETFMRFRYAGKERR
jgi:N-acetyl-alpha-D-muramate 1-phosphate uridylyltransferase